MDIYLGQYETIEKKIDNVIDILDNEKEISKLDVTDDIKVIVELFNSMLLTQKNLESDNEEITNRNKKIKGDIVKIKNKQIDRYNKLVSEINLLLDKSNNIRIERLKCCYMILNNDWKQSSYSKNLDYNKLIDIYEQVKDIKLEENIDKDINYCIELFDEIKNSDIEDKNIIINKLLVLYQNIIESDLNNNKDSDLVVKLLNEVSKYIDLIFDKNDYNTLKEKIQLVDKKCRMLDMLVDKYYGKFDNRMIIVINMRYLYRFTNEIDKIVIPTEFDSSQKNNIDNISKNIYNLLDIIKLRLKDKNVLKDKLDINIYSIDNEVNKKLEYLNHKVSFLGDKVTDRDIIQEVNKNIYDIKVDIDMLSMYVIKYKFNDIDVSKYVDKLNNIRNKFYRKCPFRVKKVKRVENLYKKYNKDSLVVSGLATSAILGKSKLIPALIKGNENLGKKVPWLNNFIEEVNLILGGMINARKDIDGSWIMEDGNRINNTVVTTSILKNLSVDEITDLSFIKKVSKVMKKISLKKDKIIDKKEEFINNARKCRKQNILMLEQSKLVKMYNRSGMEIDEFCNKYNLSNSNKEFLMAVEKLREETVTSGRER